MMLSFHDWRNPARSNSDALTERIILDVERASAFVAQKTLSLTELQ